MANNTNYLIILCIFAAAKGEYSKNPFTYKHRISIK